MNNNDLKFAQGVQIELAHEHIIRMKRSVDAWKVLGLPVLLAISGFVISSGNSRLFSIEDREQIFLYVAPVWILLHFALAFGFETLVKSQTAAILHKMQLLKIRPNSRAQPSRGGISPYSLVMSHLDIPDFLRKPPLPQQLQAAMIKFHRACRNRRILPYTNGLAYLEYLSALAIWVVMLVSFGFILSGRTERAQGFSGTGLVASQVLLLAFYIMFLSSNVRELAFFQALVTVRSRPKKRTVNSRPNAGSAGLIPRGGW